MAGYMDAVDTIPSLKGAVPKRLKMFEEQDLDEDVEANMSWKNLNKNAISAFEEYGVKNGQTPAVEIMSKDGPLHRPVFIATAKLGDRVLSEEKGSSKQEARVLAAEVALNILSLENPQQSTPSSAIGEDNNVNPVPAMDPVSAVMEYAQFRRVARPEFKLVSKEGPPHMPVFNVGVKFGDETFEEVQARSMKEAKKKAACVILNQLNKDGRLAECFPSCRFTQSSTLTDTTLTSRNPISELNEFCQKRCVNLRFENKISGPSHKPEFKVWAILNRRRFEEVTAGNIKAGKTMAAQKCLDTLEKQGAYKEERSSYYCGGNQDNNKPTTLFEKIACAALSKVDQLMLNSPLVGRKVVAAIVMTTAENEKMKVVSVGSGNRCLKGDQLRDDGTVLHDSHAEVLARRGFKRYLYKLLQDDSQKLLCRSRSGKWTFRPGVAFHLYISSAPCGDGALFVHSEKSEKYLEDSPGNKHEPIFSNMKTQGLLRVKQENGEGTIPIEADCRGQTFDGVHGGERLKVMSCSDKICRWNVLGIQGALLSTQFEPIYLQSVVLGSLYHSGHLSRALCCRANVQKDTMTRRLPRGYRVNYPDLGLVTSNDRSRATEKSRPYCLNWCFGDSKPEITDGTTGLTSKVITSDAAPSRLCKQSFLQLYRSQVSIYNLPNVTYGVLKLEADEYNHAKLAFKNYMKEKGFGTWIEMPKEVNRF